MVVYSLIYMYIVHLTVYVYKYGYNMSNVDPDPDLVDSWIRIRNSELRIQSRFRILLILIISLKFNKFQEKVQISIIFNDIIHYLLK